MSRKITVAEAREFFAHPSQRPWGIKPEEIPGEGFEFWADGPVCGVFHGAPWPGVVMAHYAVKPEGWGKAVSPARRILAAFWDAHRPGAIMGWTSESNRAAMAFNKRLGFEPIGRIDLPQGAVIMQTWRP